MLKIQRSIIDRVTAAREAGDLYEHLRAAIQLEHATIPPYLTALYSIKKGTNVIAAELIRSVLIEEMLHMAIAANTLNAIGGQPEINSPHFIPTYPGPLPMNIGTGLRVGLAKLSRETISTFMQIEEPETPLQFPLEEVAGAGAEALEFATIGDFYRAIVAKLGELGDDIFTGSPARQVVDPHWFPATELFPVTNAEGAKRALGLIIEQGEGTKSSPLTRPGGGEMAHYYRFSEVFFGRRLRPDPTVPEGFSYSGEPVPLDETGVWDLLPNPKAEQLPAGSRARRHADQFNHTYTRLLTALQQTFDGQPERLKQSLGLMYELRLMADTLISTQVPGSQQQAAPSFEYAPLNH
jgi:hypothetical protein